jgi:hypothetical protein
MKWIGQHIWDFISRFRTTVYLENLETSSEENVLVVDSDGKVTKNTTLGGSDLTITDASNNRIVTSSGGSALLAETYATFVNTGNTSTFILYSNENVNDYISIGTTTNGGTRIQTVDADAALAHLTLLADGDTIVQTTDGLASKNFKINNGSNTAFLFNGESGNISKLTIYEQGGDSADDFFTIQVDEHGATTIQTTDGGGTSANLQIAADGTAELAGTTVTLDSAANVELEVGAATNYVQTTGIFRGSNIGTIQDDKIIVLPTDFNNPSSFRYPLSVGATGAYVTASSASINYVAQKVIPKGYTATSCVINGSDADANSELRCYETDTAGTTPSAVVAATTISSGAWTMSFTSNIVGDGSKVCTIYFDPADTSDRIYGGHITITKTT